LVVSARTVPAQNSFVPTDGYGGVIAPYTATFSSPASFTADVSSLQPDVGLGVRSSLEWDSFHELDDDTNGGSKRYYLPVLYSLLWPGAGEIAMGYYVRGFALAAIEAAAWTGYFKYHDDGLQGREAYEGFADANWAESRWITSHPAVEGLPPDEQTFENLDLIGRTTWGQSWPGYHTYAPKAEQKQNYYENIGKYDWFISGWSDWDPLSKPANTALRDEYRAMRKTSNDDLKTADQFIYLSIATRVVSLLDTYLLARRAKKADQARQQGKDLSLKARPKGMRAGEVYLQVKF
jgi:hypothetical protein